MEHQAPSQRLRPHVLLLTGFPGVGKTTVIRKVADRLTAKRRAGFFTEEIRVYGRRQGFRLVTFDGQERVIAHVDFSPTYRVSKYGVDVGAIDRMVEASLTLDPSVDIYLVDEIGKMECFSERFVGAMRTLLNADKIVVATVAQKGGGFISEVKQRDDIEIWSLTRDNRDGMPERVAGWISRQWKSRDGVTKLPSSAE